MALFILSLSNPELPTEKETYSFIESLLRHDFLIVMVEPGNAMMTFRILVWPGGGGLANGLASSESLPVLVFFTFNWLQRRSRTDGEIIDGGVFTDMNLSIFLCPVGGGDSNGFGCKCKEEAPVCPCRPFLPSFLADRLCTTMKSNRNQKHDSKHCLIWVQMQLLLFKQVLKKIRNQ